MTSHTKIRQSHSDYRFQSILARAVLDADVLPLSVIDSLCALHHELQELFESFNHFDRNCGKKLKMSAYRIYPYHHRTILC